MPLYAAHYYCRDCFVAYQRPGYLGMESYGSDLYFDPECPPGATCATCGRQLPQDDTTEARAEADMLRLKLAEASEKAAKAKTPFIPNTTTLSGGYIEVNGIRSSIEDADTGWHPNVAAMITEADDSARRYVIADDALALAHELMVQRDEAMAAAKFAANQAEAILGRWTVGDVPRVAELEKEVKVLRLAVEIASGARNNWERYCLTSYPSDPLAPYTEDVPAERWIDDARAGLEGE